MVSRPAAGSAIGAASHGVCVAAPPDGSDHGRAFPACTQGLPHLVTWLQAGDGTTVAMASTGLAWGPLDERLDSAGVAVLLGEPSDPTHVQGRPTTERRDCQWLQRRHAHGLLAAACRPAAPTGVLRSDLRRRANPGRSAGQPIQPRPNALEHMHRTRPEGVRARTGLTGLTISKALRRGAHAPVPCATCRARHGHNSAETSAQALNASYRDEPRCALPHAVDGWAFYQPPLGARDVVIQTHRPRLTPAPPLPPRPPKPRVRQRTPHEPRVDVRTAVDSVTGVALTALEGLDAWTALTVIREIGTARTRWATLKHLCSGLGRCPQHKQSGGTRTSSRTRPGVHRAAAALSLAARPRHRHKQALGADCRRMQRRRGTPQALTATAHPLARMVASTRRDGRASGQHPQAHYDALLRRRPSAALTRKARRLGLEGLAPLPPPHVAPADPAPVLATTI